MSKHQFPISYLDLLEKLNQMSPAELESNVVVFNHMTGLHTEAVEFGKAEEIDQNGDLSGLFDGHFVIKV